MYADGNVYVSFDFYDDYHMKLNYQGGVMFYRYYRTYMQNCIKIMLVISFPFI
jgi:hypothetical protein